MPCRSTGCRPPRDRLETMAEMLRVIADLADPAMSGRFNRDVLDQMHEGDRDAWLSVERRLADRDRELREGNG